MIGTTQSECVRGVVLGYNVIDRALLAGFLEGRVTARRWHSLGYAWRESIGLANCAIVREDGKVLAERVQNWPWALKRVLPADPSPSFLYVGDPDVFPANEVWNAQTRSWDKVVAQVGVAYSTDGEFSEVASASR